MKDKGFMCPRCSRGKLQKVIPERGMNKWMCPECRAKYFESEEDSRILIQEIDDLGFAARVDDISLATCICNKCGTLYNDEWPMPMFVEIDADTGDYEYFKGCHYCKTDAYLMDLDDSAKRTYFDLNRKRRGRR